ncbi:hypothetical protein Cni_G13395 [Canna indica]|uniref:Uncharacterized protein n=1 Tax=Canna indica TaxID=4628 RepID=A0AAQ3KCH4_9LILI|nr:hypothetical protein Cni_G13395 [Canna indica]
MLHAPCSVCLSEFREDDALQLLSLPSQCCVAQSTRLPPAPAPENSVVVEEIPHANETMLVVEDEVISTEEETNFESSNNNDAVKETNMEMDAIVEIIDDHELQPCGQVSITNALRMSIEDASHASRHCRAPAPR